MQYWTADIDSTFWKSFFAILGLFFFNYYFVAIYANYKS